jgi:hypothetical protein
MEYITIVHKISCVNARLRTGEKPGNLEYHEAWKLRVKRTRGHRDGGIPPVSTGVPLWGVTGSVPHNSLLEISRLGIEQAVKYTAFYSLLNSVPQWPLQLASTRWWDVLPFKLVLQAFKFPQLL